MNNRIDFEEISDLVQATKLHKSLYVDESIFKTEMERIWGKAWIYVGHTSQIPNVGDYCTANITPSTPVILIRDKKACVHVLHNRCAHKGAKIVEKDRGTIRGAFRCPYHGWSYRHDGTLLRIPNESGYEDTGFIISDECNNMQPVAKMEVYRGFVFATLSTEAPDLKTWMGGAITCIDNLCDRSPEGEVEITGGVLRYEHNCNWKFILENLNDTMHPMVVHQAVVQSAMDYIGSLPEEATRERSLAEIILPFGSSYENFEDSGITGFKYGHHYDGGKTSIHANYEVFDEYREAMENAYGLNRMNEILSFNTHNTLFYPSLTIKTAIQNIRVIRPIAVDKFVVETWAFKLKGAPDAMLHRTLQYSRLINSSAGMVGPDDHEVYLRAQEGLKSPGGEWVEFHRQYGQDTEHPDRTTGGGTSDLDMRTQYKAWKEYMSGEIFQ
ncbi:MAG: aromatic ring-hydroxylating dioxygenase subunit alpha [Pseudomonadales bacterium]